MPLILAAILSFTVLFSAPMVWSGMETLDEDPCKCVVVNKIGPGTSSGTCMISGQGSVPCFVVSTVTYPQGGTPQDGACLNPPQCHGSNSCAYKDMQVSVTIAACAGSGCSVNNPVPWKIKVPGGVGNTSGTQSLNAQATYTVNAAGISSLCGTGEQSVILEFHRKDGLVAFSSVFTYGCGSCPSMQ